MWNSFYNHHYQKSSELVNFQKYVYQGALNSFSAWKIGHLLFTDKPTNSGIMQEDLQDEEFSKLSRDILELTLIFMCTLDSNIIGLIGMLTTQ